MSDQIGRMLGAVIADTKIIGEIEDALNTMTPNEFREINAVPVSREAFGWFAGGRACKTLREAVIVIRRLGDK